MNAISCILYHISLVSQEFLFEGRGNCKTSIIIMQHRETLRNASGHDV